MVINNFFLMIFDFISCCEPTSKIENITQLKYNNIKHLDDDEIEKLMHQIYFTLLSLLRSPSGTKVQMPEIFKLI